MVQVVKFRIVLDAATSFDSFNTFMINHFKFELFILSTVNWSW